MGIGLLELQALHCCFTTTTLVVLIRLKNMAEVQSQSAPSPKSAHGGGHSEKDALVAKLDQLLEKYLHTLDEYQKAREQLSKQLSSVSRLDVALRF
jgi:hypothetical protein